MMTPQMLITTPQVASLGPQIKHDILYGKTVKLREIKTVKCSIVKQGQLHQTFLAWFL